MDISHEAYKAADSINIIGMRRTVFSWSGNEAGTTTEKICGYLIKAVTDPGSPAPTDNYDIAITDDLGFNVLTNCDDNLADRDTSNIEEVHFFQKDSALANTSRPPAVCSTLTVTITNAGSGAGVLYLYWVGQLGDA